MPAALGYLVLAHPITRLVLQHYSYFALYDGAGNYLRDFPFEVHASSQPRWSRTEPAVLY